MLVGLTGRNASGKSTFVEWFSAKGLRSVSCSDSIRAWLAEQGIEPTREVGARQAYASLGRVFQWFELRFPKAACIRRHTPPGVAGLLGAL